MFRNIHIQNERDLNEMKKALADNDRCIITADYPGCGKSYSIKNGLPKEHTLYITPYNKLCYELIKDGYFSKTLHKLLRLDYKGESQKEMKNVNLEGIQYIVFDEIYSYNLYFYELIEYFMREHKQYKYYSTGDNLQLSGIGIDNKEIDYISNNVIPQMFPNNIHLKEIKRQSKEEDKQRIIQLKQDIFHSNKPVEEIFKDFKTIELQNIITDKNFSYTNETTQQINAICLKRNGGRIKVGDYIVCRKATLITQKKKKVVVKSFQLFTNYEYIIKEIDDEGMLIEEPLEEEQIYITNTQFYNNMRLNYSNTIHSIQGLTYSIPITICDLGFFYARKDPKFLWVAITRNNDLSQISICFNKTVLKIDNLENKIAAHKLADAQKEWEEEWEEEDYVDEEWFRNQLFKQRYCCANCLNPVSLNYKTSSTTVDADEQYSIQRNDNTLPHIKSNCCIFCWDCNRRLK